MLLIVLSVPNMDAEFANEGTAYAEYVCRIRECWYPVFESDSCYCAAVDSTSLRELCFMSLTRDVRFKDLTSPINLTTRGRSTAAFPLRDEAASVHGMPQPQRARSHVHRVRLTT